MTETAKQETCEERVNSHRDSRIDDLRRLWAAHCGEPEECPDCDGTGEANGDPNPGEPENDCPKCDGSGEIEPDEEGNLEDLGNIYEYGLSFDYVAPNTFNDQDEPYFRYQISWGGPSEEFRIYASGSEYTWHPYRIEFWFLDWFDGAGRTLYDTDRDLINQLFEWFAEAGSCQAEYDKATE